MKKNTVCLMLAVCLSLIFTACSSKNNKTASEESADKSAASSVSSMSAVSELKSDSTETESTSVISEIISASAESSDSDSLSESPETKSDVLSAVSESQEDEASLSASNPEVINSEPEAVFFNEAFEFANESAIHSGNAVMYRASENRKNITVGVNAGHGTSGGSSVKTYCHPDHTPKVTGGSTAEGAVMATAVAYGMTFNDGIAEHEVTLCAARIFRDKLLAAGYDVLMIRDDTDVQLDNIARTVICNNFADCHIALHWDGDGLDYDKGCFYCAVPDGIKAMYPVNEVWERHTSLGEALIAGLRDHGKAIMGGGAVSMDLTQTSYSKVPSVDIELGNQCSPHDTETLTITAEGLLDGVNRFFGQ